MAGARGGSLVEGALGPVVGLQVGPSQWQVDHGFLTSSVGGRTPVATLTGWTGRCPCRGSACSGRLRRRSGSCTVRGSWGRPRSHHRRRSVVHSSVVTSFGAHRSFANGFRAGRDASHRWCRPCNGQRCPRPQPQCRPRQAPPQSGQTISAVPHAAQAAMGSGVRLRNQVQNFMAAHRPSKVPGVGEPSWRLGSSSADAVQGCITAPVVVASPTRRRYSRR